MPAKPFQTPPPFQPKALGLPNFKVAPKTKTAKEITGNVRVPRSFNLKWNNGRWYQILLTSVSAPEAVIDTHVYVVSLRGLLLSVVAEIGKLPPYTRLTKQFTVTLIQQAEAPEMTDDVVSVQEGTPITGYEPPFTTQGPIDQELQL